MQRETDWIIEALARDPTKTRTGLAKALNVDKSAISRLLRGERRLKFDEAQRAAEYLGAGAPGGFAETTPDFAVEPRAEKAEAFAPLYPVEVGRDGLWRLDRREAIERKPRAPQFAGSGLVFGFYVPDAAMAPRFRIGEIAWVNPARAAAAGDDALIVPLEESAGDIPVFLCALEAISETSLVAVQYGADNPPAFPRKRWRALHVFGRE